MSRTLPAAIAAFALVPACALGAPVRSTASSNVALSGSPLMGINLSGCEFMANGALCPSATSVGTYYDKGFRAFRIPFKAGQMDDPKILSKLKAIVDAATSRGAYVILDRHEFGETFDEAQAAWWVKFMANFPDDRLVMIDTMNEPLRGASYEPNASGVSYATDVNAGIALFRKAGLRHKLLIEWRGWSGMQRFDKSEAAGKRCISAACSFDKAGGLKDPAGLTMISGHRYPDVDGSGTHAACSTTATGTSLLANAEKAAVARGLKIWVGEFAFGRYDAVSATCDTLGKSVIAHMKTLPQTYAGVSYWGGGGAWAERYLYKVEPVKGTFATAAPSDYLLTLVGRK